MIAKMIPYIGHVHARVGSAQSAQVANPFAPEWQEHLTVFLGWWQAVVAHQKIKGNDTFTITPEAGPFPYMTEQPVCREPLADQWEINLKMKNYLQQHLNGAF